MTRAITTPPPALSAEQMDSLLSNQALHLGGGRSTYLAGDDRNACAPEIASPGIHWYSGDHRQTAYCSVDESRDYHYPGGTSAPDRVQPDHRAAPEAHADSMAGGCALAFLVGGILAAIGAAISVLGALLGMM